MFLIAPDVENSGVINAPDGEVVLAAGRSVQLVDAANPTCTWWSRRREDRAVNLGQVVAHGGSRHLWRAGQPARRRQCRQRGARRQRHRSC